MTTPAINPNIPQKLAADPTVSSWVSASAGTGKTKVLTDRLLNLMLIGTNPGKILCLTFTKAAAAEMEGRLFEKLRHWVLLSDEELQKVLQNLTGEAPSSALMKRARTLFTTVMDLPHGIKILTIHSFCQNILCRFPLEAQVPPHFTILDDAQADNHLRQASKVIFKRTTKHPLNWGITTYFKDQSFQDSLEELLSQRHQLRQLVHLFPTPDAYAEKLKAYFLLPEKTDLFYSDERTKILEAACQDLSFDKLALIRAVEEQFGESYSDSPASDTVLTLMHQWLTASPSQRVFLFDDYCRLFLTREGTPLKKPKINYPPEGDRIQTLLQKLNALETAQKSLTLYSFGQQIFDEYQQIKLKEAALDYDDLIEKTVTLLNTPNTAAWVLYKLDGGIDHILIDEAQDTNPNQWKVILGLAEDFFRPDKTNRTLFVVGDAKQSIYSFQGAKPEDFVSLRNHFSEKSTQIGQTWRDVDLTVSFRSTPQVLSLVDKIFEPEGRQQQLLAPQKIIHHPHRHTHEGLVTLWPLVLQQEETEVLPPWTLPNRQILQHSPQQDLAQKLAQQIKSLLQSKTPLPSTGELVQPRDILILLKQRSSFVTSLIRELRKQNIPVAGADRFLLTDHLAAQDLMVLGEFLLQPLDDLALATLLRSPFIALSEENLESLCVNREEKSLWGALLEKASTHEIYQTAVDWLKSILSKQDYLPPYELYSFALHTMGGKKKLLTRLTLEAEDTIHEFLNQALLYEQQGQISLQGFLGYLKNNPIEIKRDSSSQHLNQIRLMTIHGSKGLQAPIVIIPEKVDGRDRINKLVWSIDNFGQADLMLIRPAAAKDCEASLHLKEKQSHRDDAEDKRLLYVALTRAQDHLYLCGYGNKSSDDSWYALVRDTLGIVEPWGEEERTCPVSYETPALIDEIPTYLSEDIALNLNKSSNTEKNKIPETLSPAVEKGIIIHRLLEELAVLDPAERLSKAPSILKLYTSAKDLQQDCLETTLSVLETFPEFFGKDAVNELELITAEGKLMRLDRVVISKNPETPIQILDYKTTSTPPLSTQDIHPDIRQQLSDYKHALSNLYPDRSIHTYILWTTIPRLDQVDGI